MYKVAFLLSIYTFTSFAADPASTSVGIWTGNRILHSNNPLYYVLVKIEPNISFQKIAQAIKKQAHLEGTLYWKHTGNPVADNDAPLDDATISTLLAQKPKQKDLFFILEANISDFESSHYADYADAGKK